MFLVRKTLCKVCLDVRIFGAVLKILEYTCSKGGPDHQNINRYRYTCTCNMLQSPKCILTKATYVLVNVLNRPVTTQLQQNGSHLVLLLKIYMYIKLECTFYMRMLMVTNLKRIAIIHSRGAVVSME